MISAFQKHIETNFSFLEHKNLLLTVSGGIDSIVMSHLFKQLNFKFSIAHCNFKLRGEESDADEQFINDWCSKNEISLFSTSFDTQKYANEQAISTQMAARELRYNWFEEIRKTHGFDYILTAHNKDDLLETVLINLTRGTGLKGLTGIPEINNYTVRPLLNFSRNDIVTFANNENILWREDSTNKSTKYFRNKLRHNVIPVLKELNPGILESTVQTINNLKESESIINDTIQKLKSEALIQKEDIYYLSIEKLNNFRNPSPYIYELLKPFGFKEWKDVNGLLDAQSGKQVFSKTHRLLKNRDELIIAPISNSSDGNYFEVKNTSGLKTGSFQLSFSNSNTQDTNSISVAASKLIFPLTLRRWQKGDFFYPNGMTGKKKLSKFFKDEKRSLLEKENTWVLENGDQKIIWIVNQRPDRRFDTSNNSEDILQIRFTQL